MLPGEQYHLPKASNLGISRWEYSQLFTANLILPNSVRIQPEFSLNSCKYYKKLFIDMNSDRIQAEVSKFGFSIKS